MFNIKVFNNISDKGLSLFNEKDYSVATAQPEPHGILLRSHSLKTEEINNTTLVVGRAGVGVNNVPVDYCTEKGIPVLNTPGANANAVKELVLAGMLLGSRNICQSWDYARQALSDPKKYESGKSKFVGSEIHGKTLGLIGLGNVGVKVANAAISLGMKVIGFDPHITAGNAWQISSVVRRADDIKEVLKEADYISIHVPLLDDTKHLLNMDLLNLMKDGAILLNFSRAEIVDEGALKQRLESGKLQSYVSDFPSQELAAFPQVISLPHLGASTVQAQENCAVMIAEQVKEFLEDGNITHSVNYPSIKMPRNKGHRLAITNQNVPNMLAQISTEISNESINIIDMVNRSKNEIAYTLIDVDKPITPSLIDTLSSISGIINVRVIPEENR